MTDPPHDPDTPQTDLPTAELGTDTATGPARRQTPSPARDGGPIRIPDYRILERLGSGGMGDVYVAEQQRPIRRKVALKVVKLGMDTREVVARFESERQALALMNHPNIAKVYDAGITSEGRPFFAMEYVPGEAITTYCSRHRLGLRDRLELLLHVCHGVQHAHQKGIIHRDLKPSNVLVTSQDERPVPKIIDFGIAKATSQRLTEKTMHTRLGALIGTPEYMSPEQAELTGLDVDTRSDVYSLGVILYELLTGRLPFDSKTLRTSSFDEIRRRIREEEPAKPSTQAGKAKGVRSDDKQRAESARLIRRLRGDLDWITMKALEKDRTRRYQTVNALAMDIRRHLNDEPVLASPPGTLYRVRKLIRRHRIAVAAGAAVALALVGGTIGTTAGMLRARRAESRANAEAATARQVSDFLVDLFRVSDPNEAQGNTITARSILDEGAERIYSSLEGQPLIQARLMDTIATVYRQLGLYQEAERLFDRALGTRRNLLDDDSLEIAESLHHLAQLHYQQGRYDEAATLAAEALEIREAALGDSHPAVADTLVVLAWNLFRQVRLAEAEPLFERALAIRGTALATDDPDLAEISSGLGLIARSRGDLESAARQLESALEIYERTLASNDYRISSTLNDLAVCYWEQKRYAESLALTQRTIEIKERVVGPHHPSLGSSLNNLALLYDTQARYPEAQALLERAVGIFEQSLGSEHHQTALGLANLAWVHYRQGNYGESERLYDRALSIYERTVGPRHNSVAILLQDRAQLSVDLDRPREAESALRRACSIWEENGGPEHPKLADCLDSLATFYADRGSLAQAAPLYRRVLAIRTARLGKEEPAVVETLRRYVDSLVSGGLTLEAASLSSEFGSS